MRAIGVICEYNPFHNGHAYHLQRSRALAGEDCTVICVMSGDFVQRGEPAIYSKFARAEAACLGGADLVVELPLPWSLSSAEGFARESPAFSACPFTFTMYRLTYVLSLNTYLCPDLSSCSLSLVTRHF